MTKKGFASNFSIAAAGGVLGMGLAFAGGPVGELEVRGHVDIAQQGAEETVRISDTTYGWYSGDRVVTRSGQALLSLENGASFGFGNNTTASVSSSGEQVQAALEAGVLLYALDEGTELQIESGDYRFSTEPGQARMLQVSSGPAGAAGMIEVLDDGQVQVSVREGVLTSRDADGAVHFQVDAGESVAFGNAEPRQVQVQVEAARNRDDDDDDGLIGWARNNPALAGLAIAAGGYVTYKVFFDDDDDGDPDSVSP